MSRTYFDASVLVTAALENQAERTNQLAKRWLEQATTGAGFVVTSVLTWDEFVWAVARRLDRSKFDRAIAARLAGELLGLSGISWLPATKETTRRANSIFLSRGRPRDALHIATAIESDATLVTADRGMHLIALDCGLQSTCLLDDAG